MVSIGQVYSNSGNGSGKENLTVEPDKTKQVGNCKSKISPRITKFQKCSSQEIINGITSLTNIRLEEKASYVRLLLFLDCLFFWNMTTVNSKLEKI